MRCFASVQGLVQRIVYVDSGSTDRSIAVAHSIGAEVVELDLSIPFTAARARNAGAEALLRNSQLDVNGAGGKEIDLIQFIDGDCELQSEWLREAAAFLTKHPKVAVVSGRLRERFPEVSVYNRLCDWEWDTPVGRVDACGGNALMRADAFQQTGGFNPNLIAGEEPELCVRLRAAGWQIWRIDVEMGLHDAAMTRFDQWWKRSRRSGFAAVEGMVMHGMSPERYGVTRTVRSLVWGLALPLIILILTLLDIRLAALAILAYPVQVVRLGLRNTSHAPESWTRAFFMTLAKFPETVGIIEYCVGRMFRRRSKIIEYK